MFGICQLILSSLCLTAVPGAAAAEQPNAATQDATQQDRAEPAAPQPVITQDSVSQGRSETGGQSYGDRNRGGRSGFYSFPRHRHVDVVGGGSLASRPPFSTSAGTSPWCDNCHGSAYYGRDYGAPYFGGGYYDQGVYYRERRDR